VAAGVAVGLAGLAAVAAAVGVRVGFGRLLATSAEELTLGARTRVAAQSVELWRGFPLTGSGLGTFRDAFPRVQAADQWTGAWHRAHDDWLELLVTGGVVGAALLAVGLAGLVLRLLRVLRGGRYAGERAAALAALGALAALAVHEAFDFGLTLPANAFALAVLCGAAAGASVHGEAVDVRQRSPRRRDLDHVEARRDLAGGAGAAAAPRPHDVEQPAVDEDLDEGGGLSLGDFEDDPVRRS
jgi:O-antigen ligase